MRHPYNSHVADFKFTRPKFNPKDIRGISFRRVIMINYTKALKNNMMNYLRDKPIFLIHEPRNIAVDDYGQLWFHRTSRPNDIFKIVNLGD